ncbi:MAG: hypothetical protein H6793_01930 [Candidatus Nomurabacteria bacterium]|nr:MAG: hypothetical protein H6793_01930 [Candidatus Nomurabacteria bacterium]
MKSLSIIISGEKVSQQQISTVVDLLLSKYRDLAIEVLFYLSQPKNTLKSASKRVQIITSNTRAVKPIQKAIASASGEFLLFTTVEYFIENHYEMVKLFSSIDLENSISNVYLPQKQNIILQKIGIRRIEQCPLLITSKGFVANNSAIIEDYKKLLKIANQQLTLRILPTKINHPTTPILDALILIRPYRQLFIYYCKKMIEKYKQYRKTRLAQKLRKNVPDVFFSKNIPVFIICRDRKEPLQRLISWLEDEGLKNIILIDNASTYPPLIDYYKKLPYEIIYLNKNAGHKSPWTEGIVDIYAKNKPFIVTDPDVIPIGDSHGAVKRFCDLLTKYPERTKVGFGLKIDDLPDYYELKDYVISWESQFWESTVEPDVYDAEIDTTFAVYRQNTPYTLGPGLRTGGKFVAHHQPWYENSKRPSKEIVYYRKHVDQNIGSWGVNESEVTKTYLRNTLKKQ